tara:strand:- start:1045 stop:1380 length:336 start_codon:yes stop_codon:yes gene_type:complete
MYNRNVKINENMFEYDLEGNTCEWGYFIDPSDPKRKNLYNQPKPKITSVSVRPRSIPITIKEEEEEDYEFEESDYKIDIVYKISTIGILLNTLYIIDYVLCKLPAKFLSKY